MYDEIKVNSCVRGNVEDNDYEWLEEIYSKLI